VSTLILNVAIELQSMSFKAHLDGTYRAFYRSRRVNVVNSQVP